MTDSRLPGSLLEERRRTPRVARRLPVAVCSAFGEPATGVSLDVSLGGMRVQSPARMPVGPVVIEIADGLALPGTVLEEQIDIDTGLVTARIAFLEVTGVAEHQLATLTGTTVPAAAGRATAPRRRWARGLVAGLAIGVPIAVAVGLVVLANQRAPRTAKTLSPVVATTPEAADNVVLVQLREPPEETGVASSVRPADGVDDLRIELQVEPAPVDGAVPMWVVVTNRGADPIRFPGGLRAVLRATRDGSATGEVTFEQLDVVELAPGATVEASGRFELGAPGDYVIAVEVATARG